MLVVLRALQRICKEDMPGCADHRAPKSWTCHRICWQEWVSLRFTKLQQMLRQHGLGCWRARPGMVQMRLGGNVLQK